MIPFALLLLIVGFVLIYTGIRGDGSTPEGYKPWALIANVLAGKPV